MPDQSSTRVFIVFACVFAATVLLVANASKNQNRKQSNEANQPPIVEEEKSPCEDENWVPKIADTLFNSSESEFDWIPEHYVYFVKKIRLPHGFWGVVLNSGIVIATYETDSTGHWHQTSCEEVSDGGINYNPKMVDLNFDGFLDLWIDADDGGVHGNRFSFVYIYDAKRETFKRDTTLELENLSIDSKGKRLRSQHFASYYGGNLKSLYGWKNDTLVLLGEAVIQSLGHSTKLSWIEYRNGLPKSHSIEVGSREKAWKKFNQLFWQTE